MRNNLMIRAWAIAGISGLAAIGLAPSNAEAIPCGDAGSSLATEQVILASTSPTLGLGGPIESTDCAGLFEGNEVGGGGAGLLMELNGNDAFPGYTAEEWVYLGESNGDLINFRSIGDGMGAFSLDFDPAAYDVFALSLFGGNRWGVWLFDLTGVIESAEGDYSMAGILNPGGQIPDLSHIGVAVYPSSTTPIIPPSAPPAPPAVNVVPIPATLPLFLTGLLGFGFLARRRRQMAEA